jgi:hypothetical protein
MRAAVFAIAILMGGTAAVAQTTTPDTDTSSQAPAPTTANMDPAQPATSSDATVQTQTGWSNSASGTTMASNMSATGQVVQPDNSAPRRDARGVPVISAPAIVPIGYNGTTGDATGGPLLDPTTGQPIAAASARACTRTVTDHCVQTYERRRAR